MFNLQNRQAESLKRDVINGAVSEIIMKALHNSDPKEFLAKYSKQAQARYETVCNELDSMEDDETVPIEVLRAKIREEKQAQEIQWATEDLIDSIVNLAQKWDDFIETVMIPTEEWGR